MGLKSDSTAKRTTTGWCYRLFNRSAHADIPPDARDLRGIDLRVTHVLNRMPERNGFISGLFDWFGFHALGLPDKQASLRRKRARYS